MQIAHLAGTGPGFDDPPADRALDPFVQAIEDGDPRVRRLWFDVAALANDAMPHPEAQLAERIRQIGIGRVLFGSDAATGGNAAPREAWAAFERLPLTDEGLDAVAGVVAPYVRLPGSSDPPL